MPENSKEIMQKLSVVRLTESEKQQLDEIIGNMDYKCGEDGWIPDMRTVENDLIGRYYAKVQAKYSIIAENPSDIRKRLQEIDLELRRLWCFMYWIVETCLEMQPAAYQRLSSFVDSKVEIVRCDSEKPNHRGKALFG